MNVWPSRSIRVRRPSTCRPSVTHREHNADQPPRRRLPAAVEPCDSCVYPPSTATSRRPMGPASEDRSSPRDSIRRCMSPTRQRPAQGWRTFASLVLEAAYEATVERRFERKAWGIQFRPPHAPRSGVFGNDKEWILSATRRGLELVSAFDLNVRLVSSHTPPPNLPASQMNSDEFARCALEPMGSNSSPPPERLKLPTLGFEDRACRPALLSVRLRCTP
jgi:hypothetical protein